MSYHHNNFRKRRLRRLRFLRPGVYVLLIFGCMVVFCLVGFMYLLLPFLPTTAHKNVSKPRDLFERQQMYKGIHKHPTPGSVLASYGLNFCPDYPPDAYPIDWPIQDVLGNWPILATMEDTNSDLSSPQDEPMMMPINIHDSLCVFEYPQDMDKVKRYRDANVPFVIRNHPSVAKGAERWSTPGYLNTLLMEDSVVPGFIDWLQKVQQMETKRDITSSKEQQYRFQLNADGEFRDERSNDVNEFLYDELEEIFGNIVDNTDNSSHNQQRKEISCQFDMKETITEWQYEKASNFIVVLKGLRRYILAQPEECSNLNDFLNNNPTTSNPHRQQPTAPVNTERWYTAIEKGKLSNTMVHEVVLQAGDALYLPPYWLQFIVSLDNMSYQCNAQSSGGGNSNRPTVNTDIIRECRLRL